MAEKNIPSKPPNTKAPSEGDCDRDGLDCPVCLQPFTHPVELPCKHVFCYLCVKGVANRSKRCALCRTEISPEFLLKPSLVRKEDLTEQKALEDGFQWFYEGNGGWWQYDERTSIEVEAQYKESVEKMEVLIAGFLYIVDFKNMVQYRRNEPSRCRRIKRDSVNIPKKGIAGISMRLLPETAVSTRPVGDGTEKVDGVGGQASSLSSLPASTKSTVNPLQPQLAPVARPAGIVSGPGRAGLITGYGAGVPVPGRSQQVNPLLRDRGPQGDAESRVRASSDSNLQRTGLIPQEADGTSSQDDSRFNGLAGRERAIVVRVRPPRITRRRSNDPRITGEVVTRDERRSSQSPDVDTTAEDLDRLSLNN